MIVAKERDYDLALLKVSATDVLAPIWNTSDAQPGQIVLLPRNGDGLESLGVTSVPPGEIKPIRPFWGVGTMAKPNGDVHVAVVVKDSGTQRVGVLVGDILCWSRTRRRDWVKSICSFGVSMRSMTNSSKEQCRSPKSKYQRFVARETSSENSNMSKLTDIVGLEKAKQWWTMLGYPFASAKNFGVFADRFMSVSEPVRFRCGHPRRVSVRGTNVSALPLTDTDSVFN